jgi:hypothetical protein
METKKRNKPTIQCPNFWFDSPTVLVQDARDFYPFSQNARKCTTDTAALVFLC